MSHQTGILPDEDLQKIFAVAKGGKTRLIKLSINENAVSADRVESVRDSWEDDFDPMISLCLLDDIPCYILYRLDSMNNLGYEWLFIAWSPDSSPVRLKMLYSATRASVKKEFGGGGLIKHELFVTDRADASLKGFREWLEAEKAPAPLTEAEEDKLEIKKAEANPDIGVNTKHQAAGGISFPPTADAMDKLLSLKNGSINYLQLMLDTSSETFHVAEHGTIDVESLSGKVPQDHGRFHLFNYRHRFQNEDLEAIVFIYSMPGYGAPIKERMMYSSAKNPLLESVISGELGIVVSKKLEIDNGSEVSREALDDVLHPLEEKSKKTFSKPKGPGGRGPRRMIKTGTDGT